VAQLLLPMRETGDVEGHTDPLRALSARQERRMPVELDRHLLRYEIHLSAGCWGHSDSKQTACSRLSLPY
jgi:hypothetical protein